MKTIKVNIPESVSEFDMKMSIASILFDKAIFTAGQAGEFVGISKREFIEKVGEYGVSIFGESEEDIKKDIDV